MDTDHLYEQALQYMENTVNTLAERVPQPKKQPYKESLILRYQEKTVHQALVQKLARSVSTLRATTLLMNHGFVQEQSAMQRMLDELHEDIMFLSFGVIFNKWTPLHDKFLASFYKEEFDTESAIDSTQKRPMIPRNKIRSWITSFEGGIDRSTANEVTRTISKAYSGYVHAASPQIMEMYGGNPPHYYMNGMLGTVRHREHLADLWNYYYRAIISFGFSVKSFGDDDLFDKIKHYMDDFAEATGKDYQSNDWENT